MAEEIKAQVTEIASSLTEEMASRFAGVMKAVIPDVTKPLAEAAERFQKALVTGSGPRVEAAYTNVQNILKQFDVRISDLGEDFRKTSDAFEAIEKSRSRALEEVEKLREKNIVAEARFIPNIKNNQKEYKAILLTDRELIEKRQMLLLKEQTAKNKEKELLEELKKFQKGEVNLNKKEREVLTDQILLAQQEAKRVEEEKKLYEGKGGRFETRIGGFLDDFENAVNEKAPDFLIAALQPVIDIARQFQKTVSLLITGFKETAKFVGKLLPESFTKGFADMFGGLKKTVTGLIGTLVTFGKRIVLTGITMLAAIVAPLIPLLVPLLKFAAIVGAVVTGLVLLKKGFDALTDWFRNSWLGKKIFGDKGKDDEEMKKTLAPKDDQLSKGETGTAGDLSGEAAMFDDDMLYGKKKEKPKVVTEEKIEVPPQKPKVIEESVTTSTTELEAEEPKVTAIPKEKPKVLAEKPLMPKADNDFPDIGIGMYNTYGSPEERQKQYEAFVKELKDRVNKKLLTDEEEIKFRVDQLLSEKKLIANLKKRIDLMMKKSEITGETPDIAGLIEKTDAGRIKVEPEKKVAPADKEKKDIVPTPGEGEKGQVVINNVTAPQNVASSSTQQVVAANAAKSNDDTFLNLNRHV